jgi:hypothetical protein
MPPKPVKSQSKAQTAPKAVEDASGPRARKPSKRYVEDSSWETLKNLSQRATKKNARKKEKFIDGQGQTKDRWYRYKSKISQLVRAIVKDQHTVDTYEADQRSSKAAAIPKDEVKKCNERIVNNKRAILRVFDELDAENSEHKRWEQLGDGYDDDDSVDVENIMCSACNKPDEEGNDIVFCDRAHCLRAYHQKCLDPPLTLGEADPDSTWFCRQCACMDDCLDMVGELLDADCDHHSQLFPELRSGSGASATNQDGEDAEYNSEEDEDYDPSQSGEDDNDEADGSDEEEDDGSEGDAEQDGSSPVGSDIDQDEVDGLLQDADLSADQVAGSLNSRGLRPRRGTANQPTDSNLVPEGPLDVGKEVVVVRRGAMVPGTVVAFRYGPQAGPAGKPAGKSSSAAAKAKSAAASAEAVEQSLENGVWTVLFEDETQQAEVGLETMK